MKDAKKGVLIYPFQKSDLSDYEKWILYLYRKMKAEIKTTQKPKK